MYRFLFSIISLVSLSAAADGIINDDPIAASPLTQTEWTVKLYGDERFDDKDRRLGKILELSLPSAGPGQLDQVDIRVQDSGGDVYGRMSVLFWAKENEQVSENVKKIITTVNAVQRNFRDKEGGACFCLTGQFESRLTAQNALHSLISNLFTADELPKIGVHVSAENLEKIQQLQIPSELFKDGKRKYYTRG